MHCPYLAGKYHTTCSVSREPYVPGAFELAGYCASGQHMLCPFYQRRIHTAPREKRPELAFSMKR